ncbi:type II toxin-antitoxin system RelE/ParE family toxin [uncultured Maricaulis sp.]|uniref:type II toxin-antitoxin system RelE/ParE family toxin n=1 Tax=uncultured Maricaulis sp. TaxID=174710 RepID=UPI0030D978C8|tara:strand:- start:25953 stop:26234 length:282 start_codon:yes stop_codon:yes gene_type:complete
MKRVRWSSRAGRDMTEAHDFIAQDDADAALRMILTVESATEYLLTYPSMGRQGRLKNTRELVIPHLPYLIVYRSASSEVEILRLLHTSRDRSK